MWNGETKTSQDIVIGDELVGDDGEKRLVESTCSGEDEMYEVTQVRGMSYTVNSKHRLVLKHSLEEDSLSEINEIMVEDYMKLSQAARDLLYGFKVGRNNYSDSITSITVKSVGKGAYYGWSITGNKRFVLEDMTCVRNCDQMWCVMDGCGTAFSWNSGHIVTGVVHNPHYYEWLRRNGGAAPGREVGDIPCGGMPTAWQFVHAISDTEIPNEMKMTLLESFRNMQELVAERIRSFPARMPQLMNKEIDVDYLMNVLSEDEWKRKLEMSEARFNRNKEIGQILQTLITAGSDMMNRLYEKVQEIDSDLDTEIFVNWLLDIGIPELEQLRSFGNESLKVLAKRDKMAVPQFEENWKWKGARALYKKPKVAAPITETEIVTTV